MSRHIQVKTIHAVECLQLTSCTTIMFPPLYSTYTYTYIHTYIQVPQRPIRDSELSMLSSLSISEHSALDVSHPHHYSITSLHSATVPSLPARPLSSQSQHMPGGRGVDAAAPSYRPTLNRNHQELHHTDKENISPDRRSVGVGSPVVSYPQHDGVIVAATSASEHQASDGLILFPEKQVNTSSKSVASTSSSSSVSAPSPHTQEMLRQQELQLRILQEQVSELKVHVISCVN